MRDAVPKLQKARLALWRSDSQASRQAAGADEERRPQLLPDAQGLVARLLEACAGRGIIATVEHAMAAGIIRKEAGQWSGEVRLGVRRSGSLSVVHLQSLWHCCIVVVAQLMCMR